MKTKWSVERRYNAERAAFVFGFSGRDAFCFDILVYANVCSFPKVDFVLNKASSFGWEIRFVCACSREKRSVFPL